MRLTDGPMITASSCISSTDSSGKQRPTLFSDSPHPTQTACIENFDDRYREDCLNPHWFTSIGKAREIIEDWRIDHNTEQPHAPPDVSAPGGVRSREALRQNAIGAAV